MPQCPAGSPIANQPPHASNLQHIPTWNNSCTQVRTGRLRCAAALAAAWLSICRLGLRACMPPPPPPPLLLPPPAAALAGLRACLVGEAARLLLRLLLREPSRDDRRLAACMRREVGGNMVLAKDSAAQVCHEQHMGMGRGNKLTKVMTRWLISAQQSE